LIEDFLKYTFNKCYNSSFKNELYKEDIEKAVNLLFQDVNFHYPDFKPAEIIASVENNSSWLPVLFYRLGHTIYKRSGKDPLLSELHGLMREICSMEIYFSIEIGTGFEVRHGIGSVIGSRCSIGQGFVLHHGCTIGHKYKFGNGPILGNNVEMGANSSILGEINVGNDVVIGAHSLVLNHVPNNSKIYGLYK